MRYSVFLSYHSQACQSARCCMHACHDLCMCVVLFVSSQSGDSSALDSFKQQFNDVQFHKVSWEVCLMH